MAATSHTTLRTMARFAAEAFAETLWPTRCAVCDAPGEVLCAACAAQLPYIDYWRACPRCSAPFGRVQCTECNAVMLAGIGLASLPFASLRSAVVFDEITRRIVAAYKDQGERRLAPVMADAMARLVAPDASAREGVVSFIPATKRARARRGFDHAELLAHLVAERLGMPLAHLLARPSSKDQRALSRAGRIRNMQGRFACETPASALPPRIFLIDDVCTTGATLAAAAQALLDGGAQRVDCLTFARVQ